MTGAVDRQENNEREFNIVTSGHNSEGITPSPYNGVPVSDAATVLLKLRPELNAPSGEDKLKLLSALDLTSDDKRLENIQTIMEYQLHGRVPLGGESLEAAKESLAHQPILSSDYLREALSGQITKQGFEWVEPRLIVGREHGENWSSEIEGREARIEMVANKFLSDPDNEENLNAVFGVNGHGKTVKTFRIDGPAGPIFDVSEGTHRVAATKLASMPLIPCEVVRTGYPRASFTYNEATLNQWRQLLERGLVKGELKPTGNEYKGVPGFSLTVTEEVVPWIRQTPEQIAAVSKCYELLYPGSLEGLSIPKEALTHSRALEFYLDGRFEEWQEKYAAASRNENGVI